MNDLFLILAQNTSLEERLRGLRGGFNDRPTDPANIRAVIFMIVIPVSLVILIFAIRQFRQRRREIASAPAHPMKLFDNVLRRMGVRFTDRYLLRMCARSVNLTQPTIMLFSRELFDRNTNRWLDSLAVKALHNHAATRFAAISELAFGPPPDNDTHGGRPPRPENPFEMNPSPAHVESEDINVGPPVHSA